MRKTKLGVTAQASTSGWKARSLSENGNSLGLKLEKISQRLFISFKCTELIAQSGKHLGLVRADDFLPMNYSACQEAGSKIPWPFCDLKMHWNTRLSAGLARGITKHSRYISRFSTGALSDS